MGTAAGVCGMRGRRRVPRGDAEWRTKLHVPHVAKVSESERDIGRQLACAGPTALRCREAA